MGKILYKRTSGGPFAKTADLYGSFELAHLTKVVFISATKQALSVTVRQCVGSGNRGMPYIGKTSHEERRREQSTEEGI
jgi:hypothetical protein